MAPDYKVFNFRPDFLDKIERATGETIGHKTLTTSHVRHVFVDPQTSAFDLVNKNWTWLVSKIVYYELVVKVGCSAIERHFNALESRNGRRLVCSGQSNHWPTLVNNTKYWKDSSTLSKESKLVNHKSLFLFFWTVRNILSSGALVWPCRPCRLAPAWTGNRVDTKSTIGIDLWRNVRSERTMWRRNEQRRWSKKKNE